jgi:CO/xanthine dehydrogenase FAD-binding subunit
MITQYHRPQTLEEALKLLAQSDNRPLGGGSVLSQPSDQSFAVVDLQLLGLNKLRKSGNNLEIGATVTLQSLLESSYTTIAFKTALELETPLNLRNQATVAGALVTCDGRSTFGVVMLALDTKMTFAASNDPISFGNFLPIRVPGVFPGTVITEVEIPLNFKLGFEAVARTPADTPIVCAALAQWPSGRTRLALGGWGPAPTLAMDGNEPGGVAEAAVNAFTEAGDEWATSAYRREMAGILAKRCLDGIS